MADFVCAVILDKIVARSASQRGYYATSVAEYRLAGNAHRKKPWLRRMAGRGDAVRHHYFQVKWNGENGLWHRL